MLQPGVLIAVEWQPVVSPLKIWGAAALLAALATFAYLRVMSERRTITAVLLAMRLITIGIVATLMMGPSRELPQDPVEQQSRLTILLDTSESMLTGDCEGDSRIRCIAERVLTPEQLSRLQEQYSLEVRGFDEAVHPISLEQLQTDPDGIPSGRATHLAEAVSASISRLLTLEEGDVLLVISDGRDTTDASMQGPASLAASRNVPIYTLGVGGNQSATDAALLAVPMQESLLPSEPGGILVKVYHSGLEGQEGLVRLRAGDETQRIPVRFDRSSFVELQLNIEREEPGQYEFEVSLDPLSGEVELSNNAQSVFVEVMKQRIRVLILEGQPFWDSKFLAQSLRKDEQIELTQITQVGQSRQETILTRREESADVPRRVEEWQQFDVIVLGKDVQNLLDIDSARALVKYVESGGGQVVFARGPAWSRNTTAGSRLASVLDILSPVEWGEGLLQDLSLRLTPTGRTTAWLSATKMNVNPAEALERLPGFELMARVGREKSGSLVIARAEGTAGPGGANLPAITRMNYGRGQVVAIHGEGLWRWSLLPPENEDLRGFYDVFWSNLIRWLALGGDFSPGQQVALNLSRTSLRRGDELTVDVAYRQAPPTGAQPRLELTGPEGQTVGIALKELPGQTPRYRAELRPEELGVHTVVLQAPGMSPSRIEKKLNVYEVNLERLQTSSNFLALAMLAEHSGGEMFDLDDVDELHHRLTRHHLSMLTPPQLDYIWDRGLILFLLLGWAGAELIVRRRAGLW